MDVYRLRTLTPNRRQTVTQTSADFHHRPIGSSAMVESIGGQIARRFTRRGPDRPHKPDNAGLQFGLRAKSGVRRGTLLSMTICEVKSRVTFLVRIPLSPP
jgi:hypothetical protein